MDQTALKDRARACVPCQTSLRELGPHLPADDAALDRLVGELVADREALAFTNIVVAAVAAGRPVEARHLEQGAALFVDPAFLVAAAMHLRRDVAGALVRACAAGRMGLEREVTALLVAAVWCQAAPDRQLPEDLVPLARVRARKALGEPLTLGLLAALVDLVPDEGLRTVIKAEVPPNFQALGQGLRETLIEPALQDPLAILPVHPAPAAYSGSTLRRSAPKVRRNDPCPCGSGRKYKHCCLESDQQRERAETFTTLGGLPIEKILAQPELHLTRERLRSLRSYELERLDPDTVPRELRMDLLFRLSLFHEFDLMVQHLEHWGWSGICQNDWEETLFCCCNAGRRDLLERIVALPGPGRPEPLEIPLFVQVCLNEDNPATLLKLIETTWAAALREPEVKGPAWLDAYDLTDALLSSSQTVLGIALAHGLIPLMATGEGLELIESVLSARDRLNLPPHEPVEDVLDRLLMEPSSSDEDAEAPEVAQARAALETKAREAERLRRNLAEAQHELQRQERLRVRAEKRSAAAAPAAAPGPEAAPPPELADLRRRLKTLKADLTERRQEQNELRHQLDAERRKVAQLEENLVTPPATPTESGDPELLLPVETTGPQPVRLPEFPAHWPDAVEALPAPVVRAAVVLAGRLAAGEAAAFRGVKRLRRDRELLRQKVGRDHRLLFRLSPGKLTVVELLNRRDFETRLKALT